MTSPYDTLGVPEDAGPDAIKAAYRKQAKATHPDANPGDAQAAEKFGALTKAYDVLIDPEKRQRYDSTGETGAAPPKEQRAEQIIAELFDAFLAELEEGDNPVTMNIVDAITKRIRGGARQAGAGAAHGRETPEAPGETAPAVQGRGHGAAVRRAPPARPGRHRCGPDRTRGRDPRARDPENLQPRTGAGGGTRAGLLGSSNQQRPICTIHDQGVNAA